MPAAIAEPHVPPAPRHPFEMFKFFRFEWDIARFWRDHDEGRLALKKIDLDREFIEAYATGILGQDPSQKVLQTRFSLLAGVSVPDAMALPVEALKEPLVFLQVPQGRAGVLRLPGYEKARHVLADGNHRATRAYHDNVQHLSAYLLTLKQSNVYLNP